jgi:hypothetical protein
MGSIYFSPFFRNNIERELFAFDVSFLPNITGFAPPPIGE